MVAPFNQAWMLLKQRGHELNLPPPRKEGLMPLSSRSLSPQDLTDGRVDEASLARGALDAFEDFEDLNSMHQPISNAKEARDELGRRHDITGKMNTLRIAAELNEAREKQYEEAQRKLDQQTLARMGQQPEADEMDAMGVPEMSRSIGGRGPAPSEGRAGSSGLPPVGSEDLSPDYQEFDPEGSKKYARDLDLVGPIYNPFTQKPATTEHLENSLQDWAAGAGREAGMPQQPFDDLSEGEGLHENNPAAHNIGSTNVRASPRQQRRGRMDSGRPYFKKPDREGPIGMSPSQRAMKLLQRNAAN